MGGIQAREGSLAEVHAVRGGQLILRVAACQMSSAQHKDGGSSNGMSGGHSSNIGCTAGLTGPGGGGNGSGGSHSIGLSFVIPYDGRCYILKQSMDVLEKIFYRLTPRELALLSLTCRTMNLIVNQFLEHVCSSYGLKAKVKRFYEENCALLLPKELVLKDRLELNSKHELLLYSAMWQFLNPVRRVSVCKLDHFAQLNSDSVHEAIFTERDVALKREVVVVRKLRALHFKHTFRHVRPGKYVIQLRMRLSNALWEKTEDPQYPAVVKVTSCRRNNNLSVTRKELVSQKVDPKMWSLVESHQEQSDLENASFIYDRDSDWLFLRMKTFEVPNLRFTSESSVDIEFEFEDWRNQNWKHGVIFDFLEMRSVLKKKTVT